MAPGGFPLVPKSLAGAICFTTPALSASAILTFLLIVLLILSPLLLDKLLNLMTLPRDHGPWSDGSCSTDHHLSQLSWQPQLPGNQCKWQLPCRGLRSWPSCRY